MRRAGFVARFLAVILMSLWVGGLAAYGALVLPVLHARFTVPGTAPVTRQFTGSLNLVALVVLIAWAVALATTGSTWRRRTWRAAWIALVVSAAALAAQFALHVALSRQMDLGVTASRSFYPLHRVYLLVSTVQWLVNLVLIGLAMRPPSEPNP